MNGFIRLITFNNKVAPKPPRRLLRTHAYIEVPVEREDKELGFTRVLSPVRSVLTMRTENAYGTSEIRAIK